MITSAPTVPDQFPEVFAERGPICSKYCGPKTISNLSISYLYIKITQAKKEEESLKTQTYKGVDLLGSDHI
jgi:hypothetical protein